MCWSVFYCIFRNFSQYFFFQKYISFSFSYFMCIRQQQPPPSHYPLDHFKSWCCRPARTLQWFKWNCVFSITGQGCENSRWHHDNCKTNAVLWTERCYQNGVYTILTMLIHFFYFNQQLPWHLQFYCVKKKSQCWWLSVIKIM